MMKKIALLISFLILGSGVCAGNDLPAEIRRQLSSSTTMQNLYYPVSVKRFYNQNGFKPAWIKAQGGTGPAWQAMLLLDCVMQYGLSHNDYHPDYLIYKRLNTILDTLAKTDLPEKARFEILLTDAIITLMNHLHYGKLNPYYTRGKIDTTSKNDFRAGDALAQALLLKKGYDLLAAIENVQPKSKAYRDMQYHMRLLTGLYTGDCYDVPEGEPRIMAVNMERLRWADMGESGYIQINIPSYTLRFVCPDSTYSFRIAAGSATHPTPAINSAITYFSTAPDVAVLQDVFLNSILPKAIENPDYLRKGHFAIYNKKGQYIIINRASLAEIRKNPGDYFARHASGCDRGLGNLVFHFTNPSGIRLHDMPRRDFFNQDNRAISGGCIWLEDAEKLAALILKYDGRENEIAKLHKAAGHYLRETFILHHQIPLKVTYLTCEMKAGKLIIYKDVYNLDKGLEVAMYNIKPKLVMP